MVLHLLGKKSWNVYNATNVERVRRDEADAQAREEAAEQRMQEEDAKRRVALLRGESVAPPPIEESQDDKEGWRKTRSDDTYAQRDRKRRRLRGEDDTDRDMRYARQDTKASDRTSKPLLRDREKDAPLQDHAGNIQLIPAPDDAALRKAEKNAEAEAEKAKKRKRDEDQITMRFSNAAGYHHGMQRPWYAASKDSQSAPQADLLLAEVQGKDVWGNEDPRRKEREHSRISANDPFAAMQQAQRQLKTSERDKETWQKKQQAEIELLKREQKCDRNRRRRDDVDSLDGFSLDVSADTRPRTDKRDHSSHRRHHHSRHRRRSRSRSRDQDKQRDHRRGDEGNRQ